MTGSEAINYHRRAKISAHRLGFHDLADDLAQEVIVKMLSRRAQNSTIDQIVVDCVRKMLGRPGSNRYVFLRATAPGFMEVEL